MRYSGPGYGTSARVRTYRWREWRAVHARAFTRLTKMSSRELSEVLRSLKSIPIRRDGQQSRDSAAVRLLSKLDEVTATVGQFEAVIAQAVRNGLRGSLSCIRNCFFPSCASASPVPTGRFPRLTPRHGGHLLGLLAVGVVRMMPHAVSRSSRTMFHISRRSSTSTPRLAHPEEIAGSWANASQSSPGFHTPEAYDLRVPLFPQRHGAEHCSIRAGAAGFPNSPRLKVTVARTRSNLSVESPGERAIGARGPEVATTSARPRGPP